MILASWDNYTQNRLLVYLGGILMCLLINLPCKGSTQDSLTTLSYIRESVLNDSVNELVGEKITVTGIANVSTGLLHERYLQIYIQNDSAGLSLFGDSFDEPVSAGDTLVASGEVQQYVGLTEVFVENYRVFPGKRLPGAVPFNQALNSPQRYEGMLVSGTGVIRARGNNYNGKYLMVAPSDTSRRSLMVFVSNFHQQYSEFDFDNLSVGDHVQVTGVLSRYEPDPPVTSIFKILLRTPADLEYKSIPQVYVWYILLTVSVVSILILVWILLLRGQVGKQTSIIKTSLREKEVLLQEIHHRVKNNLAIISGLIELQLDSTTDEAAIRVLRDSQVRIQSMAMVHEKLYKSATLSEVEMDVYIKELVEAIRQTFAGSNNNISIEFRLEPVRLGIKQVIPCGLLINELVVNAFKHAFREDNTGRLTIGFGKRGDMAELTVADNGPGLPADFSYDQKSSLGMMLIHTFASQLEAEVEVEHNDGASFRFLFHPKAD